MGLPSRRPLSRQHDASQSGSAIVYVFVGIILFALLAFAFSRGMSSSNDTASSATARPKAVEIMNRADAIARSVNMLLNKGCSISELNFYSDHFTQAGSANPNAPADGSCDVYSPKGGKLKWQGCPEPTMCGDQYLYAPMIPESMVLAGVGSKPEDLVYLVLVKKDVCVAINSMLNMPTKNFAYTAVDGAAFKGTFTKTNALPNVGYGGDEAAYYGKTAGCLYARNYMTAWGGEYFLYYRVLVPI